MKPRVPDIRNMVTAVTSSEKPSSIAVSSSIAPGRAVQCDGSLLTLDAVSGLHVRLRKMASELKQMVRSLRAYAASVQDERGSVGSP